MSPEDQVDALYRLSLGREPDPEGRAAWIALSHSSGDPSRALAEMLSSGARQIDISAEWVTRPRRPARRTQPSRSR
jgi:hypothetical protein